MYKIILDAHDGSDHAGRACQVAQEIAARMGASLNLPHVAAHEHAPSAITQFAESENVDNPDLLAVEAAASSLLNPIVIGAGPAPIQRHRLHHPP